MMCKYIFILLLYFVPLLPAQNKVDFSFFSIIGYIEQNNNFILNTNAVWNNRFSNIGGELTYRGGEFGETQYETNLRYVTSFSDPAKSTFTLRQLYIQVPLDEYVFLTVGKREKEFGFGVFHNVSNRLSPKEKLYGHIEKLERQAPVIFQLDWITSENISMGAFFWSNSSNKWKESNIGLQTEFQFNNFYSALYFYYEKMEMWSVGINISQQLGKFRLYGEGIFKEKNEQYYSHLLNINSSGKQFSFSTGLAYENGYYFLHLEHIRRTEGFNKNEQEKIKEFAFSSNDISGYSKNYFGKDYVGVRFRTSRLFISNLGLSLSNLLAIDNFGGETELDISYLHRESVSFGVRIVCYYGKDESEYKLYLPYNFQILFYVSSSF